MIAVISMIFEALGHAYFWGGLAVGFVLGGIFIGWAEQKGFIEK